MLPSRYNRGFFPSMPRDYIRRRRMMTRISNIVIIVVVSILVAYAIVHVSGPAPFSLPH